MRYVEIWFNGRVYFRDVFYRSLTRALQHGYSFKPSINNAHAVLVRIHDENENYDTTYQREFYTPVNILCLNSVNINITVAFMLHDL